MKIDESGVLKELRIIRDALGEEMGRMEPQIQIQKIQENSRKIMKKYDLKLKRMQTNLTKK